jgi:phenylalanyl-tRNA synthetase alpha chain
MKEALEQIRSEALAALAAGGDEAAIEALRVRYLGRKGELTGVMRQLREVPTEQRPAMGVLLNQIKDEIEARIGDALAVARSGARSQRAGERIDISEPGRRPPLGRLHPLIRTMEEITEILRGLGFSVAEGPEIEDDYHNFAALNFPADHPARDMQDTLFVDSGLVLRTHTSPVQIRVMERQRPPLRIIAPGVVYRHDSDTTHSPMFHQIEGFMVDKRITFGDLKGVLTYVLQQFFGTGTAVRLRPSFFPFTEPSAEVDIGCFNAAAASAAAASARAPAGWRSSAPGWSSQLFRSVGYDPQEVSAFGMGIERITMLKHQIDDIRLLFANDVRFLRQF